MIDIKLSMIEPKIALLQMQVERVRVHAPAFSEARIGLAQVHKAIVRTPTVAEDDTIQAYFTSHNALDRVSRYVFSV